MSTVSTSGLMISKAYSHYKARLGNPLWPLKINTLTMFLITIVATVHNGEV